MTTRRTGWIVGALAVALVLSMLASFGGAFLVLAVPVAVVGSVLTRRRPAGHEEGDVAGRLVAAAASAASTRAVTWSTEAAVPVTDADAVPPSAATKETTVTVIPCMTPLVVRVLFAQRRFALLLTRAITRQSSLRDADSARSTSSWGERAVISAPALLSGRLRRSCSAR